jgi:DNA-binding CsgD family transcriptional regulator
MDTDLAGAAPRTTLLGRAGECALLDDLVDDVRRGKSRCLVVHGEAGIGKTALLHHLVEAASDVTILRADGVEAETEMPYSSLHHLCAPVLDRIDVLPDPQREALEIVFGLTSAAAPNRFLVGLGLLGLLAEVSDQAPVLCVIDDAQWLDQASRLTLAFVARRLAAEPAGIVFAARKTSPELDPLPQLNVRGVDDDDARTLLSTAVRFKLDERVRDRIVAETRGNPLALLELPRGLTATQLAGGFGLLGTENLPGRIEETFVRRLDTLSAEARRLLLIAAAEPVGDPLLLWKASRELGVGQAGADEVRTEQLLTIGNRVAFRHPLVRSAVYTSASPQERRAVHLALAQATDRDADPDRRAWHLATAAEGADEAVALELERSAGRALARGGLAAAAAFLERAALLTGDPERRGARALAAAGASLHAGVFDVAAGLLAMAESEPLGDVERARAELLRARLSFATSRGSGAPALLLRAAQRLEPLDAALARETYLEALAAAQFAGRLAAPGEDVAAVAEAALSAPPAMNARPSDLLLDGLATVIARGYESGAPAVQDALQAFRTEELGSREPIRWTSLACRTAVDMWDFDTWELLSERMVDRARQIGAPGALATALTLRLVAHLHAGQMDALSSLLDEVEALNQATGTPPSSYGPAVLVAWRGDEREASALIHGTLREASARGEGQSLAVAHCSNAVLHNGLGRFAEALEAATAASAYPWDLTFRNWSLAELVEAAARSGRPEVAMDALAQLQRTTQPCGTDWALGTEARCRALVSAADTAEERYREAITRLERSGVRPALARTHLLYGEWLRQENRRDDARTQLRRAHDLLSAMGMLAFAERARNELLATGERARKPASAESDDLTPQERQIAQLASDGLSNPEIGARLFLSPRTIEWHLHKVFGKLGIRSRRELPAALGRARGEGAPA